MLVERILLAVIGNGVALGFNDLLSLFLNYLFALAHAVVHETPTGSSNRTNHEQHNHERANTTATLDALNRFLGAATALRRRLIERGPLALIGRLRCVICSFSRGLGLIRRLVLRAIFGLRCQGGIGALPPIDRLRCIGNLMLGSILLAIFFRVYRIDKVLTAWVHCYLVSWSFVNTPLTI